jgi:hypothetical protein
MRWRERSADGDGEGKFVENEDALKQLIQNRRKTVDLNLLRSYVFSLEW